MKAQSKNHLLSMLCITVLGLCVYANALDGPFLWDDYNYIEANRTIRSFSNFFALFRDNIAAGSDSSFNYYRPVQELSYMVDYFFWRLQPRGYHITNVLIHILVSLGVYLFAFQLSGITRVALIAGVFFVIHPIQTESVNSLVGRGDPLSFLFLLFGWFAYVHNEKGGRLRVFFVIFLCFLLALLTKENAVIIPILLAGYHLIFARKPARANLFAVFLSLCCYALIRIFVFQPSTASPLQLSRFSERIPGFFNALAHYFRLLLAPAGLHFDYGQKLFSYTDLSVILGVTGVILLIFFFFRYRDSQPVISFCIFWFLINLLPYSNIYLIYSYMAEHYLYVASAGYFIIFAILTDRFLFHRKIIFYGGTVSLGLLYAGLSVHQNTTWSDPFLFYKRTLQFTPDSAHAHANLGIEYGRAGDRERALFHLAQAAQMDPRSAIHHINLGTLLVESGRNARAQEEFQKALAINPHAIAAYNGLGIVYLAAGDAREAAEYFEKALQLKPSYLNAANNLIVAYLDLEEYHKALNLANALLEKHEDHVLSYYHKGVAFYRLGNEEHARRNFQNALALNPAHPESHFYIALMMKMAGEAEEAKDYLKTHLPSRELYDRAVTELFPAE